MNLSENMIGRSFEVITNSGEKHTGKCVSYIPAKDNEPEIDSIAILSSAEHADEIYATDIKTVKQI